MHDRFCNFWKSRLHLVCANAFCCYERFGILIFFLARILVLVNKVLQMCFWEQFNSRAACRWEMASLWSNMRLSFSTAFLVMTFAILPLPSFLWCPDSFSARFIILKMVFWGIFRRKSDLKWIVSRELSFSNRIHTLAFSTALAVT